MPIPNFLKTAVFQTLTSLKGDGDGRVCLTVLRGPAKGLRFRLDLLHQRESAYFLGKYEPRILRELIGLVQPGWVTWDVGTYLGFYSVFFSRLVGPTGRVVSIEPDPQNFERTRSNLLLNGFESTDCVPAAVGAPAGEIDFLVGGDSNSHIPGSYVGGVGMKEHYRHADGAKARVRIPCISLDQAIFERGLPVPNLIKIDIEGAELQAMQHMSRLCTEIRPLLILELHNSECDAEAWSFASRMQYLLYRAEDGHALNRADEVYGTLLCVPEK